MANMFLNNAIPQNIITPKAVPDLVSKQSCQSRKGNETSVKVVRHMKLQRKHKYLAASSCFLGTK
eukprot:3108106-Amphidinium_carterae.1